MENDVEISDAEKAYEKISELVEQARMCVKEAKDLADKYELFFTIDIAGRGMGGYYNGEEKWWVPSSQSCE